MLYCADAIPDEAQAALAPAFDRFGLHDAGEWVQRCRSDLAQLWREGTLWAVTEVIRVKPGQALHIVAMAGEYAPRLLAEIEAWAKARGCKAVLFTGRRGWERKLPTYQTRAIVMEKRI